MRIPDDAVVTTCPVLWNTNAAMFAVVGEQYYSKAVRRMKEYIREHAKFIPHSVFLCEQDDNPHDDKAVAVMFSPSPSRTLLGKLVHNAEIVGHLPRDDARSYRRGLATLGLQGRPFQVPGCVVSHSDMDFDNVSLYLPRNFATLVKKGAADDPENKPEWLSDERPIAVRPHRHSKDANAYSESELRRLYCRYAQVKSWSSLPPMIDEKIAASTMGIGPVRLAVAFHHLGIDELSEEGKKQLGNIARQTIREQRDLAYNTFDDATLEDLRERTQRAAAAASDAEYSDHAQEVAELCLLESLKKAESVKFKGLLTAWKKIRSEAGERLVTKEVSQRFLGFAERKVVVMLQLLMSDVIRTAMERANSKKTPAARNKAIDSEIEKVRRSCADFEVLGVGDEVERFSEYMEAQKLTQ